MKTVLVALNARFAHSSLALRYLKAYNQDFPIYLAEFNINDPIGDIYQSLLREDGDVYGFSCYIWNIEPTLKLVEMLKKAKPLVKIFLGGPEAGYRYQQLFRSTPYLDGILVGEGEETLHQLLSALSENAPLAGIPGLVIDGETLIPRPPLSLSSIPLPYTKEDLMALDGKIIYFETSRGCPFRCSYCLSSAEGAVRAFPMDYVKAGLSLFFEARVPLVKLIDRTFNYDSHRAAEIISFILEQNPATCIHLEIEPQILTEEILELLKQAPKGLFQLEMGIQSANPETLSAIGRSFSPQKLIQNIQALQRPDNIHLHLDLIAGLPYEDYESFGRSFDFVYQLKPDMLQLGFLKVLHGTKIADHPQIIATDFPPYEVLATDWLSPLELSRLKEVEAAVELFYNSGAFPRTIEQLTKKDPFSVFEQLGRFMTKTEKRGKRKRRDWYQLLYELYGESLRDALSKDFLCHNQGYALPPFTRPERERGFKDKTYTLCKNPNFCETYGIVPDLKRIRFERMDGIAYMMDYQNGILHDITKELANELVL